MYKNKVKNDIIDRNLCYLEISWSGFPHLQGKKSGNFKKKISIILHPILYINSRAIIVRVCQFGSAFLIQIRITKKFSRVYS